jgi:hypothetical protein
MTMGIQNDGGTCTTMVPGRNGALYSLTNDFVQFLPPASTTFCTDMEEQTLLVTAQPVASIVASGPVTLCAGDTVTLTASGTLSLRVGELVDHIVKAPVAPRHGLAGSRTPRQARPDGLT